MTVALGGQVRGLLGPHVSTRFVTTDDGAYQAALRLRHRVFYEASGIPLHEVPDSLEAASMHLVAEIDREVCGYGRLTPGGRSAQISQMVVDAAWRRRGVGSALLAVLTETAAQLAGHIRLSAQLDAVPFYRSFGFAAVGEPHPSDRLRIPVQDMEMYATAGRLTSSSNCNTCASDALFYLPCT
jgi:predicted GNAT family N-acyltransferase